MQSIAKLKVRHTVTCPAERGNKPYVGHVVLIEPTVHRNYKGIPFQWVHVKGKGHVSVWASYSLGYFVEENEK